VLPRISNKILGSTTASTNAGKADTLGIPPSPSGRSGLIAIGELPEPLRPVGPIPWTCVECEG
jgi:hypothetical protein